MSGQSTLFPFHRGDTKVFNLSFKDSSGDPINITGHSLWFTMKAAIADLDKDATLQKQMVFPAGTESENGTGVLTLTSDETKTIDPGLYFFDIQKVIPENPPVVATVLSGRIAVLADITRNDGSS